VQILGLPPAPPDPEGRKFISPTGTPDAEVMVISGTVDKDENSQGECLVGMTGQTFDAYLWRTRLPRHSLYCTNIVKRWGGEGENEPRIEDVIRDWDYLMAEIRMVQPKLILALGSVATQHLISGTTAALYTMDALNGKPVRVRIKEAGWEGWVIPLFHPSAGLYNAHMAGLTYQALERARDFLDAGLQFSREEEKLRNIPAPEYQVLVNGGGGAANFAGMAEVVRAFNTARHYERPLAVDTEGYKTDPWCISFSDAMGCGYLVQRGDERLLREFERTRKRLGVKLLLHNSLHDLDVLAALGIILQPGEYEDSMVKAFVCQSETPKGQGLKPLGFKYADVAMEEFSEITAEAETRIAKTYLDLIREGIETREVEYERKGKAWPIERRIKAILAKPVHEKSMRARWAEVCKDNDDWKVITEAVYGPMPRVKWEDVELDRWRSYACADPDVTGRVNLVLNSRIQKMRLQQPYEMDMGVIPVLNRMSTTGILVDKKKLWSLQQEMVAARTSLEKQLLRIAASLGKQYGNLNLNSGDQLAPFIYGPLGLSTRRMTKSRSRESVDEKALSSIQCHKNPLDTQHHGCRRHHAMAHVFVDLLLEYKEVDKILNAYVVPLWRQIGSDGRVHANWRHTVVVSGRLATNSPNLLAFPAHSKWGKRLRACLVASPGHVILSCDQSQIELRVLASEARDQAMMGVFLRGLDLHAATAMEIFGVTLEEALEDDGEGKDHCRFFSKTINFGVAYGLTARGLSEHLAKMGVLKTVEECQRIIDQWFAARPGVQIYLQECIAETRRYGYVRDMWDRIRFLPQIWSPVDRIRAEAERQAGNFKIQAGAQGSMKLGMAYYWNEIRPMVEGRGIYCNPILQVHDDLMMEIDEDAVNDVSPLIEEAVTYAAQEKFHVPITCGTKIGKSWGELVKGRIYVREDEEEVGEQEAA
jgi:uracil-DNA glycosylase family 4